MTHVQLEEHYFEEHADNGVMGNTSSAPDMDQAAMHYAAAAEQLLESEELGRKAGKRSKREKEVPGGTIKAIVVAATTALKERGEADGEGKRRKKKKKHGRQTSQEEESAQALLALNKGGVAGEEDDGEAPKKRKKKKSAKKDRAVSGEEEAVAEVEMLDLEPVEAPASVGYAVDNAVESGLQQQMEIPERVTAEHLAAHMAKSSELVVPVVEEQLDVGQRLINELQNHTNIIGGDGFVPVNPNLNGDGSLQMMASTTTGKTPKKRKRISDNNTTNITTPMPQPAIHASTIEQIDPQLMELDHATQMAASEMAGEKKRRRRANTAMGGVSPMEGDEDTDTPAKKTTRRKPSGENKPSWGTAPASGNGEAAPGGTFTLDERFAIDKALQDYCKVHSMTMDELRDRVWGNNRKKDVFWDSICNAVPNRSRASVYKHVRRSCHIFQQRAKWTADEDAELADMVKEKGNKWKDIGEAMGRMGEDCRDRYRNYVKCGKDRGTDRWSEEEEELLKKTVAEHKEITRQILLEQGKDLPPPEEEDTVLINWTTVSEKMQNKRSRIQCRYKWKKMQAQKEKVKAAPIGVTYVGGKKKRINFNIEDMTAGDRQWLLYQIRDCGATQENEIPWDQFAKNDKEVGIWTHKDLKNAYKNFRAHIPHKRRPLSEIIKQLLAELEQFPLEERKVRFIPLLNPDGTPAGGIDSKTKSTHMHTPASHMPLPHTPQQPDFDHGHQIFQMVGGVGGPNATPGGAVAPVASMGPSPINPYLQSQNQHQQHEPFLDPALMGQGGMDLQRVAGEAMQQVIGEDENDQQVRTKLVSYIQGEDLMGPA